MPLKITSSTTIRFTNVEDTAFHTFLSKFSYCREADSCRQVNEKCPSEFNFRAKLIVGMEYFLNEGIVPHEYTNMDVEHIVDMFMQISDTYALR